MQRARRSGARRSHDRRRASRRRRPRFCARRARVAIGCGERRGQRRIDASIDAANDGDSGASQPDAARDAAADASQVATADACVADGGDPSLRFGAVYRRTINDGSGTGCTTSSRCHGRPGEQFDLSSESAAYASLVGAMGACGVRVAPCNLADSYLSRLMHNPDTCRGARHTGFAQVMTPAQIAELDAWILGGAQR